MEYNRQIITELRFPEDQMFNVHGEIIIDNCIIEKLSMSGNTFDGNVIIKNSIIDEVNAVGAYFYKGLLLFNCIVNKEITFEAGGHNEVNSVVSIQNNIFNCFLNFFDAHFDGPVVFSGNQVLSGSNLYGNKGLHFATLFNMGITDENNNGNLYVNEGL
jgi:hypothetical protein